MTPLDLVVAAAQTEVADWLRRGVTPLDVVVAAAQTEVADWLRARGGEPGTLTGVPLWLESTSDVDLDAVGGSVRDPREDRISDFLDEVLELTDGVGSTLSLGLLRQAIEADEPVLFGEAVDKAAAEAVVAKIATVGAVVRVGDSQKTLRTTLVSHRRRVDGDR